MDRNVLAGLTLTCPLLLAAATLGQDSVSQTPGNSDALSAYGQQTVRYTVDLSDITSSWGNTFAVAPILKGSADTDPLFPTQILGATGVSADHLTGVSFPSTDFASWSTPGAGVHPTENAAAGTVSVTGFDRQFGVAVNDFTADATNVIGTIIGQNASDPGRLYVRRTVAAASRASEGSADTATLSLGATDAAGLTYLRADDFEISDAAAVLGENIARVDVAARSAGVNTLTNAGASDAAATSLLLTNDPVTLNTPTALPGSLGNASGLMLDFAVTYRVNGGAGTATHLNTAVAAHRGNPSFVGDPLLGAGVGTAGCLGVTSLVDNRANALNLFDVDGTGSVVADDAAVLPAPFIDGAFSANAAGDAEFHHYYSQMSFRGPNGPVALGRVSGNAAAAAAGRDPTAGEFIAAAVFDGGPTWHAVAYEGKAVLDGPGGTSIGMIVADSPATFSSPALDGLGNVYFVASFEPTAGSAAPALIKGVWTGSGYDLELLLATGDTVSGANSGRDYTIDALTLADADSMASGSLHGGSVLQPQLAGFETTTASDPGSFGGLVVNAMITYDNGGTPESYEAALFVGPSLTPTAPCPGDATDDGLVNFDDLNLLLAQWNTVGPEGDVAPSPDGDGMVNFADLNLLLAEWGADCN